jgi:hypothetical protein
MDGMHLLSSLAIQPNLELKTRPKQLFGSHPSDIELPVVPQMSINTNGAKNTYNN